MKKILVVSDTHGYTGNLDRVMKEHRDADLMIHLGDVCNDEHYIMMNAHFPVKILKGNNDWTGDLPDRAIMNIGGHKIFATHGHRYQVYYGAENLMYAAAEQDCDIIMYGHTHIPFVEEDDDFLVLNPGSLTYPRQSGNKPSYIIMNMKDDGNVECEIKYLTRE